MSRIRSPTARPGVAPHLLHGADEVAGQPLAGQLGRHVRVEDDEPAAGQHRDGLVGRAVGDHGLEGVLARRQRDAAADDRTVGRRPTSRPDLLRPDDLLHLLAEARPRRPRVDGQPLGDADLVGLGVVRARPGAPP